MTPIRTDACNLVYVAEGCFDLPVLEDGGCIYSYWRPSPEELAAINAGLPIQLCIVAPVQPPVSLDVEAI